VLLVKPPERLNDILQETEELIKIFVSSIRTAEKEKIIRRWMFIFLPVQS
jgi:hypothetical protein